MYTWYIIKLPGDGCQQIAMMPAVDELFITLGAPAGDDAHSVALTHKLTTTCGRYLTK